MSLADRNAFLKPVNRLSITFTTRIGEVRMLELTNSQLSEWRDWVRPKGKVDKARKAKMMEKLVTLCVVDAADQPILTEEDVDVIAEYPSNIRLQLIHQAAKLNGLSEDSNEGELLGKSDS